MQTGLVLFTFLPHLLLNDDSVATLLVLGLHLILFLLLCCVIEVFNLTAKLMKAVLRLAITTLIQVVAINVDLCLDVGQRLGNDRLDHEEHLAKADCVL